MGPTIGGHAGATGAPPPGAAAAAGGGRARCACSDPWLEWRLLASKTIKGSVNEHCFSTCGLKRFQRAPLHAGVPAAAQAAAQAAAAAAAAGAPPHVQMMHALMMTMNHDPTAVGGDASRTRLTHMA